MINLKPCPFCGGEAELCYSEVDTFCRKCNVMQETELWNTRPIEDALNARIAELKAAQRWIPVSERLPEATGDYIVTCDGWSNSEIAYWNFPDSDNPSGWLEYMQYIWSRKPVKYWMPLPKPPEVQE